MAITTGIAWCDATANFWIGCTKVSPACDHCYAEAEWANRRRRVTWGPHGARDFVKAGAGVIRTVQKNAAEFCQMRGRPPIVFINSLSDFADNHASIDPTWRTAVWNCIRTAPDVMFVILTKRPQNLPHYLPEDWGDGWPNVILGTTAENQVEADRRLPHLVAIPATIRLVSAEPLLGAIDLTPWLDEIGWVIGGGESGPNARPCHPDWAHTLRDQCAITNVPFFWKQWGEWIDYETALDVIGEDSPLIGDGQKRLRRHGTNRGDLTVLGNAMMIRAGLKTTGHLLDGAEHHAFPHIASRAA